jgi:hypothetical protein
LQSLLRKVSHLITFLLIFTAEILKAMVAPSSYSGAKIELIERDMKTEQIDTFIDRLIS